MRFEPDIVVKSAAALVPLASATTQGATIPFKVVGATVPNVTCSRLDAVNGPFTGTTTRVPAVPRTRLAVALVKLNVVVLAMGVLVPSTIRVPAVVVSAPAEVSVFAAAAFPASFKVPPASVTA